MRKEVEDILAETSRKLFQQFVDARRRNDNELRAQIQEVKRRLKQMEEEI